MPGSHPQPPRPSWRGGGEPGQQPSWCCNGESFGGGGFGVLGSPSLVAPFSPSLLAGGSLSAPRGTLGCCVQGGGCATTHPALVSLPALGVSAPFFLCSVLLLLCICSQIPLSLPPSAPLPVPGCLSPPTFPQALIPFPGGGHTYCSPGDPHAHHGPKGGGSTQDPGSWQCRQGAWTGMVTVALAPWRARLGTRSPPGTAVARSLAAEGGVWPWAGAQRLPSRGALWDAKGLLPFRSFVLV